MWLIANAVAVMHFLSQGTSIGKRMLGIRQVVMIVELNGQRIFERLGVLKYLFNVFAVRPLISSFTLGNTRVIPSVS